MFTRRRDLVYRWRRQQAEEQEAFERGLVWQRRLFWWLRVLAALALIGTIVWAFAR